MQTNSCATNHEMEIDYKLAVLVSYQLDSMVFFLLIITIQ